MEIDWTPTNQDTQNNQGSDAWHEFRKKHIGASEISAILGESDFSSPTRVFEEKTNRRDPFKGNFATERGKQAEPDILRLYQEKTGRTLTSPVLEHPEYKWMSASLDGWHEETKTVVEFKYPGAAKHELARQGEVPRTYRAQLQQQMLVAGGTSADYVSYNGKEIVIVTVYPDKDYQKRIIELGSHFWNEHVLKDIPPEAHNILGGDEEEQIESAELEALLLEYDSMKKDFDFMELKLKEQKAKIGEKIGGKSSKCAGFRMTYSERKGAVSYEKIPELNGVDLDKYRKKPTVVFTISSP